MDKSDNLFKDRSGLEGYRELFWKYFRELDDTIHMDMDSYSIRFLREPQTPQSVKSRPQDKDKKCLK